MRIRIHCVLSGSGTGFFFINGKYGSGSNTGIRKSVLYSGLDPIDLGSRAESWPWGGSSSNHVTCNRENTLYISDTPTYLRNYCCILTSPLFSIMHLSSITYFFRILIRMDHSPYPDKKNGQYRIQGQELDPEPCHTIATGSLYGLRFRINHG